MFQGLMYNVHIYSQTKLLKQSEKGVISLKGAWLRCFVLFKMLDLPLCTGGH